jgi:hypothetical protein
LLTFASCTSATTLRYHGRRAGVQGCLAAKPA